MKFYVETFGCQMNTADSREMSRRLLGRGLSPAAEPGDADVIVVNTCTVRDHAEHRALSYLGRLAPWKGENPQRCLILAGCAAERLKDTVQRRFPQVSVVVGAKSISRFDEIIEEALPTLAFDGPRETADAWGGLPGGTPLTPGEGVTAHVTLMRGCNFNCAYCIVPAVRGRELYRPAASVLAEVASKAAQGQPEVLLLGQTVNSYRPALPNPGPDGRDAADFADLLRAVGAVPGVRRVRFMSPHPFYVNDRFIAAFAETPTVCPHLHLPVQSGSDAVLARMKRNHTRRDYLAKTDALRRAVPGLALTTDFIVGFPGETEADFHASLDLARDADFDGLYAFKYSPRPGTAAAALPDDVPTPVKEERLARLHAVVDGRVRKKLEGLVGTVQEVMVEGVTADAPARLEGRTAHGRKIFVDAPPAPPGTVLRARVRAADGKTLHGTPLDPAP